MAFPISTHYRRAFYPAQPQALSGSHQPLEVKEFIRKRRNAALGMCSSTQSSHFNFTCLCTSCKNNHLWSLETLPNVNQMNKPVHYCCLLCSGLFGSWVCQHCQSPGNQSPTKEVGVKKRKVPRWVRGCSSLCVQEAEWGCS